MNEPSHDAIIRGVLTLFRRMDMAGLAEVSLGRSGRRADILALDRTGKISIVEVKASLNDFRGDQKWQDYLAYCDAFFFAVGPNFPTNEIPEDCGLILSDGYDADIVRHDDLELKLNGQRRRSVILDSARLAMFRTMLAT